MSILRKIASNVIRFHPRYPTETVPSIKSWVESYNQTRRGHQRAATLEAFKVGDQRILDFSNTFPVSKEDYLLDIDIERNKSRDVDSGHLLGLPDAHVLGSDAAILLQGNKLVEELSLHDYLPEQHPVFFRLKFPKPVKLKGSYASLLTPFSNNYYHWVLEALPKLKHLAGHSNEIDGFFVPQLSQFHRDTLAALGIPESKLIPLHSQSSFACDFLYALTRESAWTPEKSTVDWFNQSLNLSSNKSKNKVKLYISRSDSGWRTVSNESAVIALLDSFGYQTVNMSDLNFKEQATLLNSAESVIGVHGAGLTNIMFCQPETKFMEIFPKAWTSLCYLQLANTAGLRYSYMNAEEIGLSEEELNQRKASKPQGNAEQGGSISIPLSKLEKYLKASQ